MTRLVFPSIPRMSCGYVDGMAVKSIELAKIWAWNHGDPTSGSKVMTV